MKTTFKLATLALLASTFAIAPANAAATHFLGNYTVSANSGSGLIINTHQNVTNLDFALNQGESFTYNNLFSIFTNESSVNIFEDTKAKQFSLTFNFTAPDVFGGNATGSTFGVWGVIQKGKLIWDNGGQFEFNYGNGGLLSLDLSNATFNKGWFGLNEGEAYGADVSATFTLVNTSAVPEPASWLTMIAGFGLVGYAMRRRKVAFAA